MVKVEVNRVNIVGICDKYGGFYEWSFLGNEIYGKSDEIVINVRDGSCIL